VDSFISGHSKFFFRLRGVESFISGHSQAYFCLSGADLSYRATQSSFFV
jgi:hypothetical protein